MTPSSAPIAARAAAQRGSFLLEALVSVLIVALGILGLIGLQARAIQNVDDAQYRGEAAYVANALLGQMWLYDRTKLIADFDSSAGGPAYTEFKTWVGQRLPGANIPANAPVVTVTQRRDHADADQLAGLHPRDVAGARRARRHARPLLRDRRHRGVESMTMTTTRIPVPPRQRGMGIVEVMVGILIGMIVVAAIYNVFAVAEGYKRTAVGAADAQTTGIYAQFVLRREIAQCRHRAVRRRRRSCDLHGVRTPAGPSRPAFGGHTTFGRFPC